MIFLNPFMWVLLPAVLAPILWYLKFFKKKETLVLPSLFFAKKVRKIRRARSIRNVLLELLLEILFLLCILTLLAQPIFRSTSHGKDHLVIFVDNTLSMGHQVQTRNNQYYDTLRTLVQMQPWKHIEIFDVTMMLDEHSITSLVNEADVLPNLQTFLSNVNMERRSFEYAQVADYLERELTFTRDSYAVFFLTDYKDNHAKESFEIDDLAVILDKNVWQPPSLYPVVTRDTTARKSYFVGEDIPMQFELTSEEAEGIYNVEIFLDETSLYVDTFVFQKGQTHPITINLQAEFPGVAKLSLVVKNHKEALYEYFSTYKVLPKLFLDIQGQPETVESFKQALAYDFNEGHIVFQPDASKERVRLYLDPSEQILTQVNNTQLNIIFLNTEKGPTFWNNFLAAKGYLPFSIGDVTLIGDNAFRLEGFPVTGELASMYRDIGTMNFLSGKEVFTLDRLPTTARVLLAVQDRPMAILNDKVLIFPFDPVGGDEGVSIFDSPEGLILFYEGLFELFGRKHVIAADEKVLRDFAQQSASFSEKKPSFVSDYEPGIYELEEKVFVINIPPEEVSAPKLTDRKAMFKQYDMKDLSAQDDNALPLSNQLTNWFSFRSLLKGICLAIIVYLMFAFLRRNQLIGNPS